VDSSVKHRHTADHHTDLLRPLGIQVENVPLSLHLPDESRAEAAEALSAVEIDANTPFAVIHAGTARPEKYWQPERWAEVASLLRREYGLPVLLTGSRDAAEHRHVETIQRALASAGESRCPNLSGRLSLLGTAAVLSRARLLCAVDSAPVHLADALDVPLVALFGPTNPYHWRPRRASACVVTAAGAPPFSPAHPQAPMSQISTASVAEAIRTLVGIS
jgi:ADP-heptose:LPS heptosyltransferase